jgi:hypothetical protein
LLILDISGLASIQKEFFIFHIVYHSNKNSFCIKQILLVKIASDLEPPPWRKTGARQRAGFGFIFGEIPFGFWAKFRQKPLGRASRVPHVGFKKAVEFVIGVFIVPSSNPFPKPLMCHARSAW